MLTDDDFKQLIAVLKRLVSTGDINFPPLGEYLQLDVISTDGREKFVIDVNRKGKVKVLKCTYLTRYNHNTILLRVDIDGPPHMNPDGSKVPCPHIHIYREGYDDKWAFPLAKHLQTNPQDLFQVLIDFFKINNVIDLPRITMQGGDLI